MQRDLPLLELKCEQAHAQLIEAQIVDEGEDPAVFAIRWDERSDEYRALYDKTMPAFVDENGKTVSRGAMSKRRMQAEKANPVFFSLEEALIKRWQQHVLAWDKYRLYYSKLVLAFIDREGQRQDEASIRAAREKLGVTEELAKQVQSSCSERVEKCRVTKQKREYQLLMCRERMLATDQQLPEDSDYDTEDSIPDGEMATIYAKHVEGIDKALQKAQVVDGEDSDVFEQKCDVTSDEYQLLYAPEIKAFVGKDGNHVSKLVISSRRDYEMLRDPIGFPRKVALVKRRLELVKEWDTYRLYDSKEVVAFIDSNGQRQDEASIRDAREEKLAATKTNTKKKKKKKKKKTKVEQIRKVVSEEVEKCRVAKQAMEHHLLQYQELAEVEAAAAAALARVSLYPVTTAEESTLRRLKKKYVHISEEDVVLTLETELDLSYQELGDAVVAEEKEDPGVFTVDYMSNDDYYALFYPYPLLKPFVDANGTFISVVKMMNRRLDVEIQWYNHLEFKRGTELARRWLYRAVEWDQYRMYDSERVLTFVDRLDERHDEASITQCREKMDPTYSAKRVQKRSKKVTKCFHSRHKKENALLLWEERALALSKLGDIRMDI